MRRDLLLAALATCVLAACNKPSAPDNAAATPATAASGPALLLAPEDLRRVADDGQAQGPVVTGSIQPERRADLRAEVPAVVKQVLKENGEVVHRGDLLVLLDDTALRESLASADAGLRASNQAFEQAQRQVDRLKTLRGQGMVSEQALEDAEVRRNSAQSELVAARARVASARQQLQRTEVRAPFDGVVSDRKASPGDTAQVGKELLKVIDPGSMRFEGTVSADRMHEVRIGANVSFRVNGYPDTQFAGTVRRVDASADPTTRQVEVLVAFSDPARAPRVAGLYAEGRIEAQGNQAAQPMLPPASVVRDGGRAYVWRVQANTLHKVPVQLGERDPRTGEYPVLGGVAGDDRVVRNPGGSLVDGQRVEFSGATATAAASSAVMR